MTGQGSFTGLRGHLMAAPPSIAQQSPQYLHWTCPSTFQPHVSPSAQFIEKENAALAAELAALDASLAEKRDTLGRAKAVRVLACS